MAMVKNQRLVTCDSLCVCVHGHLLTGYFFTGHFLTEHLLTKEIQTWTTVLPVYILVYVFLVVHSH